MTEAAVYLHATSRFYVSVGAGNWWPTKCAVVPLARTDQLPRPKM